MWEGEAPAESRLRRSVALPKQNPNDRNIHAIATLAPPRRTLVSYFTSSIFTQRFSVAEMIDASKTRCV